MEKGQTQHGNREANLGVSSEAFHPLHLQIALNPQERHHRENHKCQLPVGNESNDYARSYRGQILDSESESIADENADSSCVG